MTKAIRFESVVMEFRLVHERFGTLKEAVVRAVRGRLHEVEQFRALDGVSFEVAHGETLGIIGHNGSGKTTTLRLLAGVLDATEGHIQLDGQATTLIELGSGFNPHLSGEENVYLMGALYGASRARMRELFPRIVAFAELERFIEVPVKNYSSGMSARLGFSIATHLDPDILIVDEVLAVGDDAFQKKCLDRMQSFRDAGKTIVVVSHQLGLIESFTDRAILLDHGRIVAEGAPADVTGEYRAAVRGE